MSPAGERPGVARMLDSAVVGRGQRTRSRLADAYLYLCCDRRMRQGDLSDFLDAVLAGGVDVVQLREKGVEARDELDALEVFAEATARHGALLAVNDRADVAAAVDADVLHLGQRDLPVRVARRIVGDATVIGHSSHSVVEADIAACQDGVDYYCVGPVWATPTKPGRAAPGLGLVRHAAAAASRVARPWFAIGGIDLRNLDEVLAAGASRVVVVRALTESADPGAVARELSSRLRAAASGEGIAG